MLALLSDPIPAEWVGIALGAQSTVIVKLWYELNRTRRDQRAEYAALEQRNDERREAETEFRTTTVEVLRSVVSELQDCRRRGGM